MSFVDVSYLQKMLFRILINLFQYLQEGVKYFVLRKMGCFAVLKGKKKKYEQYAKKRDIERMEFRSTTLPEPESQEPSLQSAPPSFRNRTKTVQPTSRANIRARARSAPSSLVVADRDALSIELDDSEEFKGHGGTTDQRFSSPLPLPLPSPQGTSILKTTESFKMNNVGNPMQISGPLPLPPLAGGGLRNFSYEEISSACQNFSADRCVSEGLSSTVYKATFGDDIASSKKLEATVARLLVPQVTHFCSLLVLISVLVYSADADNITP